MSATMVLLLLSGTLRAQEPDVVFEPEPSADGPGVAAGVIVGEPTGLTGVYRPDLESAVQAHLSYSLVLDRVRLNVDYLNTLLLLESRRGPLFDMPVYLGVGATVGMATSPTAVETGPFLGLRMPLGAAVLPRDLALGVFMELAPVVYMVPATSLGAEVGMGARYYF